MQLLQEFCRERDAVFIFDEIQANFGRTGPMYAFTQYGVEPDIVCLGKGLGNGIPVSCAVGRADIFAALK
jgi:acetylornithine/succinyldiaminopimelate/putrescine aminotransferase